MTKLADLEARIRVLEDIESIKKLKYRYFRALDKKLWDELAECFTEDAVADWGPKWKSHKGREAIVNFSKRSLPDTVVGIHQGHNPEIEITSNTTAEGVWELWDYAIDVHTNAGIRLMAFYEDAYAKERGEWKIKTSKIIPLYTQTWKTG
jgi:hypothetical protein